VSKRKQIIGGPLEIGGRVLSLSRAIRAGDFVFLTGQIPMQDGTPMITGTIEEQTRAILDSIYGEYFPVEPPTRSAVVSDLLVDARVEVEVIAYRPLVGTA
jgi:2-iminobutanoate/2-iminopropanoate deaminase